MGISDRMGPALLIAMTAMLAALPAAARLDGKVEGAEWRCTLTVNPLRGDVSTSRSGGNWSGNVVRSSYYSSDYRNESKTVTRNMKWSATVRCRGKTRPERLELKVDYIAHKGNEMKYYVLKSESRAVALDKGGKCVLELESPTTRLTRSHSTNSSSSGSYSSGFRSVRSRTSGQQVDGCIARLYADGQLIREWMSNPGFGKLAKAQRQGEK